MGGKRKRETDKPAAPEKPSSPEVTEEAAREIQERHQRDRVRRVEDALKRACRQERVVYVPQLPRIQVDGGTGFLGVVPVAYQFVPRESAPPAYLEEFDREVLGVKDSQNERTADAEPKE